MGAASIAVALWRHSMRFNPKNPEWFNRDRFVLSAGHACLLQYIQFHFTGYEAWTMDAIKSYHNPNHGVCTSPSSSKYSLTEYSLDGCWTS